MTDNAASLAESSLYRLIGEIRRLHQQFTQAGAELHEASGIPASARSVMEALYPDQALTVPDIAREKNVTRQHIQVIVNELLERNLVQAHDNPAHKRSPLIRLTPLGRLSYKVIASREAKLLDLLAEEFDEAQLRQALATLEQLSEHLAAGRWRDRLAP